MQAPAKKRARGVGKKSRLSKQTNAAEVINLEDFADMYKEDRKANNQRAEETTKILADSNEQLSAMRQDFSKTTEGNECRALCKWEAT